MMATWNHVSDSAWEAAHNVALEVLDGSLLHHDAPWSPDVPDHLKNSMPDLTGRISLTLPWSRVNPINPEEDYVWLFDNTAFRPASADRAAITSIEKKGENSDHKAVPSGQPASDAWQAEFVAAYFIKNSGKDISKVVADMAKKLGKSDDEVAKTTIKKRLEHFVATVLPRHTVKITSEDGKTTHLLGPSSASGISSSINDLEHSQSLPTPTINSVPGVGNDSSFLASQTVYAEPTGLGVISDIDDTIKITQTDSAVGILRTTFLDEPEPVPGMPDLYKHINTTFQKPPFFYLSASPYNLYPFLRTFRDTYYPAGTIILRDASWQNIGGLISSLTQDVQAYKVDRVRKIHAWFPGRHFICLGDSTQKDPESYGQIAREFPGWVKGIFIHKVVGVSGVSDPDQDTKNAPERFEKAFEGLDKDLWLVFEKAEDVAPRVDAIAAKGL